MMHHAEGLASAPSMIGYAGASIVALAYFLNQRGSLPSQNWKYPGTNLLGSLLIMVSLLYETNPPSVLIEVFWSGISVYGVQKNIRAARWKPA